MKFSRRSFLSLLGIAPVAISAAPVVVQTMTRHEVTPDILWALFNTPDPKIGETIKVKKPMQFAANRPIHIDEWYAVEFEWDDYRVELNKEFL